MRDTIDKTLAHGLNGMRIFSQAAQFGASNPLSWSLHSHAAAPPPPPVKSDHLSSRARTFAAAGLLLGLLGFAGTTHAQAPNAPTGLAATPGDGEATLSWTTTSEIVTIYQYRQKTAGTFSAWRDASTATRYTVTNLVNGTAYAFQVRGCNGSVCGAASFEVALPAVVSGLSARLGFNGELIAEWTVSTATLPGGVTISHYTLERRDHGTTVDFHNCGQANGAAATRGTCGSLANGTRYELHVRAVDTAGMPVGLPSASVAGTPEEIRVGFITGDVTISGWSSATFTVATSRPSPSPFRFSLQGAAEVFAGVPGNNCLNPHRIRPLAHLLLSNGSTIRDDNIGTYFIQFDSNTTRHDIVVLGLNRPIKCNYPAAFGDWEIIMSDTHLIPNGVATGDDQISINILAQRPTAVVAGTDLTFRAGHYVRLDGSQSLTDVGDVCCPTPELSRLAYAWKQLGGDAVPLVNANTAVAGFIAPSSPTAATLSFRLTVTDDTPRVSGNALPPHSEDVTITVLPAPAGLTAEVSGVLSVTPSALTLAIGDALTVSGGTLPGGAASGATIAYEWWRSEDDATFELTDRYAAATAAYTVTDADGGYWLIPAARFGIGGARSDTTTPLLGAALQVAPPDVTFNVTLPDNPVAGFTVWKAEVKGDATRTGQMLEYRFQSRPSADAAWQSLTVQFSETGRNRSSQYPGGDQPIPQSLTGHQLRTDVRYVGANGLKSANWRIATSTEMVLAAAPLSVALLGDTERGATLRAAVTPATVPFNHEVAYQWYISDEFSNAPGTPIPGATSSTYTVTNDVVGRFLAVGVRYRLIGSQRTTAEVGRVATSRVTKPLEFEPASFDNQVFLVNQGVSLALPQASGGQGGQLYRLTPEQLPPGLSFTTTTGTGVVITGTPTSPAAEAAFTYSAIDTSTLDDEGGQVMIALTFTITVEIPPVLLVANVSAAENEAGAGGMTFTAMLNKAGPLEVTVEYGTNDNTADGSEGEAKDYTRTTGTLAFAPGEMSKTVVVPVADDAGLEGNDSFYFNLFNAVNTSNTQASALGTIMDDDTATFTLSAEGATGGVSLVASVAEGSTLEFCTRTDAEVRVDEPLVVMQTSSGTAMPVSDYTPLEASLTFSQRAEFCFPVQITTDTVADGGETFTVELRPVDGPYQDRVRLGTPSVATVRIIESIRLRTRVFLEGPLQ